MQSALRDFNTSMVRVRHLHALHSSFSRQLTSVIDLSDVLRAEVVLVVSALDYYIHQLARLGMLESWRGARPQTEAFKKFSLSTETTIKLLHDVSQTEAIFENEIRERHSFATFQQPDKIADAIRLFSDVKLWEAVALKLGIDSRTAKNALSIIVGRRNKIAHEADVDPSYSDQLWPIDARMVKDIIDQIEKSVQAIYEIVV